MNALLRRELLEMRELDVSMRQLLVDRGELADDSYHPEMKAVHERNNERIKHLIREYGWPLRSEVGDDGAEAAWLIVQHAVLEPQFQEECVELLRVAVEKGEAQGWHLAYLQDRVLVQRGEPQIYGTQHEVKNGKVVPKHTLEPERVNEKRAGLGLWSQEEHTANLQKDYDTIQTNKVRRAQ
jgi:hypothetical protein